MIIETRTYNVKCDDCKRSVYNVGTTSKSDIIKEAYERGWLYIPNPPTMKGLDKHFCPDCQSKRSTSTEGRRR